MSIDFTVIKASVQAGRGIRKRPKARHHLLYFYGDSDDMEPSALFTAKIFIHLSQMDTVRLKAPGGQALGGAVCMENISQEIKPVLVKRAQTKNKDGHSTAKRKTNFEYFRILVVPSLP